MRSSYLDDHPAKWRPSSSAFFPSSQYTLQPTKSTGYFFSGELDVAASTSSVISRMVELYQVPSGSITSTLSPVLSSAFHAQSQLFVPAGAISSDVLDKQRSKRVWSFTKVMAKQSPLTISTRPTSQPFTSPTRLSILTQSTRSLTWSEPRHASSNLLFSWGHFDLPITTTDTFCFLQGSRTRTCTVSCQGRIAHALSPQDQSCRCRSHVVAT